MKIKFDKCLKKQLLQEATRKSHCRSIASSLPPPKKTKLTNVCKIALTVLNIHICTY